jgi:nicotinamide riboside kinase
MQWEQLPKVLGLAWQVAVQQVRCLGAQSTGSSVLALPLSECLATSFFEEHLRH